MIPWVFELVCSSILFLFLRSFFQEFDDTDTDDTDDEAEEENTDDLHKSMSEDTDNIFDFISDFC